MVPRLGVNDPPDLPGGSTYTLHRDIQHPACLTFSVPSIALHSGSGLLTRFPSATAFALTLGADSPCADERCAGNLGLSASMPFTCFIATHVSIRTSDTSSELNSPPSQAYGTLSYHAHTSLNRLSHPIPAPCSQPTNWSVRGRFECRHNLKVSLDSKAMP